MATGDIGNNIKKLQKEIKLMKYKSVLDLKGLTQGLPSAFLPLYHYAFTNYSHAIAEEISSMDAELFGKSDLRFIEAVYKILRDMFQYKPPITKDQFFSSTFAEKKIIMCTQVLSVVQEKNKKIQVQNRSRNKSQHETTSCSGSSKVLSISKSTEAKIPSDNNRSQKEMHLQQNSARYNTSNNRVPPTNTAFSSNNSPKQRTIVNKIKERQASLKKETSSKLKTLITNSATSKTFARPSTVEVKSNPKAPVEEGSFIETIEINAFTPTKSGLNISEQQDITDLHSQITEMKQVLVGITTKIVSMEKTVDLKSAAPGVTEIHPNIVDAFAKLQQCIDSLTARLILLENRMTLIESKFEDVPSNPSVPWARKGEKNPQTLLKEAAVVHNVMTLCPRKGYVTDLLNGLVETSNAVSPIKQADPQHSDVEQFSIIPDDEFQVGDSEKRQSSTPTSLPILRLGKSDESSFTCHFDDDSTEEQVERIKNM
ncbi:hypothetical protein ScPMuIL_010786 [Solemya velum]